MGDTYKRGKRERRNTSCNCRLSRTTPGVIVLLDGHEVMGGLLVYCGESKFSGAHHMVELIREDMEPGRWHMPCGQVYIPYGGAWPYTSGTQFPAPADE